MTDQPLPTDLADYRFQRDVVCLHRLGSRAIFHILDEIACRHSCRLFIEDRARRYAQLDRGTVIAVGGDSFPPVPLHEVGE